MGPARMRVGSHVSPLCMAVQSLTLARARTPTSERIRVHDVHDVGIHQTTIVVHTHKAMDDVTKELLIVVATGVARKHDVERGHYKFLSEAFRFIQN